MEESRIWIQNTPEGKWTEPHSPWQNRAELDVREAKRGIRRFNKKVGSPWRLWCFLGELVCKLRSFTTYDSPLLQGRCAAESALGYTPDISPWVQHAWYEDVWYRDVDKIDKLGLWLGAATRHGGGDAFWILGKSCKPTVRSTVWSVTVKEKQTLEVQSLSEELHASVKSKIGDNHTDDDEVNQELEDIFPEPDEDVYLEDDTKEEEEEEEEETADRRSEADEHTRSLRQLFECRGHAATRRRECEGYNYQAKQECGWHTYGDCEFKPNSQHTRVCGEVSRRCRTSICRQFDCGKPIFSG